MPLTRGRLIAATLLLQCSSLLAGPAVKAQEDDYSKLEPLYRRAVEADEAAGGRHSQLPWSLNRLATLYKAMGRYGEAEPLYRRSIELAEKDVKYGGMTQIPIPTFGESYPASIDSRFHLAALHAARGRYEDAATEMQICLYLQDGFHTRYFVDLPLRDLSAYIRNHRDTVYSAALSLGLTARHVSKVASSSSEWVMYGKGLAQSVITARMGFARHRQSTSFESLRNLRKQIATAVMRDLSAPEKLKRDLFQLRSKERDITSSYMDDVHNYQYVIPVGTHVTGLKDVVAALPSGHVLVDIAKFRLLDFGARKIEWSWQEPHYAAWIISPENGGSGKIVDLGLAEPIEKAIAAVRDAMKPSEANLNKRGEPAVEQDMHNLLRPLSQLVLQPLMPHIGQYKKWFLSPDAALWLVPWSALLLPDGRYTVEDYQIHYVNSGSDLARTGFFLDDRIARQVSAPVVISQPDYDLIIIKGRGRLLRRRTSVLTAKYEPIRELPGMSREANAILPSLRRYTGVGPKLLLGARAGVRSREYPASQSVGVHLTCILSRSTPVVSTSGSSRSISGQSTLHRHSSI